MKKFIVLYYSPTGAAERMATASPEDMKKGMETWMAWAKKIGKSMLDLGTPLGNGKKITKGGHVVPSERKVAGYTIVQADSIDDAVELVKAHPHLDWVEGAEVEVHEALSMPGM